METETLANSISYRRKLVENDSKVEIMLVAEILSNSEKIKYIGRISQSFLLCSINEVVSSMKIRRYNDVEELVLYTSFNNDTQYPFCFLIRKKNKIVDEETLNLVLSAIYIADSSNFNLPLLLNKLKVNHTILYDSCLDGEPSKTKKTIISYLMKHRLRSLIANYPTWNFVIDECAKYDNGELISIYISFMKTKENIKIILPEVCAYLNSLRLTVDRDNLPIEKMQQVVVLLIRSGGYEKIVSQLVLLLA
jgi:hypothetical protein